MTFYEHACFLWFFCCIVGWIFCAFSLCFGIKRVSFEGRTALGHLWLEELNVASPSVDRELWRFFGDFVSDAQELLGHVLPIDDRASY